MKSDKMILAAFAIVLAALAAVKGMPIQAASMTVEIKSHIDGTVDLIADMHFDGYPAANSFVWSLPDGSKLSPGSNHGSFSARSPTALPYGSKRYTLHLKDGYTFSVQNIVFRVAAAQNRWVRTFNYKLSARIENKVPSEIDYTLARLSGETDYNSDGSIMLKATVSGGNPRPDTFQWILPSGASLRPGQSRGSYRAQYWPSYNNDGSRTYYLSMKAGLTASSQTITFKASAKNKWWSGQTFTLQAKTAPVVIRQGRVLGQATVDSKTGRISIEAEIQEGTPRSTSYVWTVQQPNGRYVHLKPGEGQASALRTNARGNPSTTLTISSRSYRTRTVQFYVTSNKGGRLNWWASRKWTISRTAPIRFWE